MKLQLVTFEQAKALKEFGFPQDLPIYYELKEINGKVQYIAINKEDKTVFVPTLELTAKWLRDEKDIHIDIIYMYCKKNVKYFITGIHEIDSCAEYGIWNEYNEQVRFSSYEEALSAGIDKAIEILKQQ